MRVLGVFFLSVSLVLSACTQETSAPIQEISAIKPAAKPAAKPVSQPVAQITTAPNNFGGNVKPLAAPNIFNAQNLDLSQYRQAQAQQAPVGPLKTALPPVTKSNARSRALAVNLLSQPVLTHAPPVGSSLGQVPDLTLTRAKAGLTWSWPTPGHVTELFTMSGMDKNKGIDIVGQKGQAVYASSNGQVLYSGVGSQDYGKMIIIKHTQNFLTVYSALGQSLVQEGANVTRGTKIALLGSQGLLHFEIRKQGVPVDPLGYLAPLVSPANLDKFPHAAS